MLNRVNPTEKTRRILQAEYNDERAKRAREGARRPPLSAVLGTLGARGVVVNLKRAVVH